MVQRRAEYEVQRTIKRAELTAFTCILRKVIGPIKIHVGNKGKIDGLRKGKKECIEPRAGDADLWIKNWEELHSLVERGILVEVGHVKAHRTKKRKRKICRSLRSFVMEGNDKADDLAKARALLDKGFMVGARARTMQQEREEVHAALQYAASCHCLVEEWKDCEELRPKPKEKWVFVEKSESTMHRTEWCAEAHKYRCVRCGRGSKHMKMLVKCTGPEFLTNSLGK